MSQLPIPKAARQYSPAVQVFPVTQKVAYIEVLSDGEKADQPARITVAEFSRVTAERDAKSITSMPTPKQPPVAGGHGTIRGTVSDPSGAVIQNANVTLTSERAVPYIATTDASGAYEFTGLHLPASKDVVGPVVMELPDALNKGDNKLELSVPTIRQNCRVRYPSAREPNPATPQSLNYNSLHSLFWRRLMQRIDVKNRRLVYLGAIDDKVVQYKVLSSPAQQLNRLLFFSTILGDPLVLNDGYLLHSGWGRDMLIDSDSPVRQLNAAEHVVLASRSEEPYSQWVSKQAKKTTDYQKLHKTLSKEYFEKLDAAQSTMKAISWPPVDLQVGLNKLLGARTQALVAADVPRDALKTLEEHFGDCVAQGGTVRDCWEKVLIAMEAQQKLDSTHKNILMEVANEAYHVNFAAGLATMNGGAGVGVSGYGRWRFDRLEAYCLDEPQQIGELLASDDLEKYYDRIFKAATVRIPKKDGDLYGGGKFAQFIRDGASAKEKCRKALREFVESGQPINQRVEAFETALQEYARTIDDAFGIKTSTRWFTVINFFRISGDAVGAAAAMVEGYELTGHPLPTHAKAILAVGQHALHGLGAVVSQLRRLAKHVRSKGISLLPEWNEGFYELDLDPRFAQHHSAELPPFPAS